QERNMVDARAAWFNIRRIMRTSAGRRTVRQRRTALWTSSMALASVMFSQQQALMHILVQCIEAEIECFTRPPTVYLGIPDLYLWTAVNCLWTMAFAYAATLPAFYPTIRMSDVLAF